MRQTGCAILLSLLALPLVAWPEPVKYTVDKWHTRIYFSISHMGLSNFGGRFLDYDIEFVFDEETMANSNVEVTVPVTSIDTFSPELNSKIGDEMFFDSANHPEMRFVSTNIEQVDAKHAMMTGDLTIKGTTLPVTFDVTFNNKVMHPFYSRNNAGFSAIATIDSRAYDVNRLPDWMVGSDVNIRIELEAFEGDGVPYYTD